MDTQHSLLAAAWHGLPLPIFEVALDLDRDEADYPRKLARLVDTALTYVLLVGMARCVDTPGWPAFAANLAPLFVDPGPGKRARAIRRLERERPGCTGWQLDDPVEEGRALWAAVRRPRRQNAPSILECLEMLAQFRNKGPGHDELPVDVEKELGFAVRQTLPHLLDRNHYVKKARLLVLSDVSRVTGGQVEWTARVCAGAVPVPYGEGQRLRAPEERWMVRGAVCLRDRTNGEIVSLDPFVRWHDEHMYLLHSLGGKTPCLLNPARRTELPTVDLDAFDRRLPGWRDASKRSRADDATDAHADRAAALPPAASAGVWAHHDVPVQTAPSLEPVMVHPRASSTRWGCRLIAAGIFGALLAAVVAGTWLGLRYLGRPSIAELRTNLPPGWVLVERPSMMLVQTHEATVGQFRRCMNEGECTSPAANPDISRVSYLCMLEREDPEMPVNCIWPRDARDLCAFLGDEVARRPGRPPTRAEWSAITGWSASEQQSRACRANICDHGASCYRSTPVECTDGHRDISRSSGTTSDLVPIGSTRPLEHVYGNLAEIVRVQDHYGAAGRSFRSGQPITDDPLLDGHIRDIESGVQYGVRCVVPLD